MRDIDAAFATLNQQVSAAVRPPAPAEIIGRARRRTGIRAAVASVVAAAALGGGAVLAAPGDDPTPTPTPTPSVSESTPSPTPSTTPSSPPPSSPPAKAPRTSQPVARDIPYGFLLYDEAVAKGEWKSTGFTNGYPLICSDGVGPPELHPATSRDLRHATTPGKPEPSPHSEAFHVYASEAAARRALDVLRDEVARCPRERLDSSTIERTARRLAIGDDALRVSAKLTDDAGSRPITTVVFVRRGIAIAEYRGLDASSVERDARRIAKRMCRYDPDCQPADGFPSPVPDKHGQRYWVAVLAVGSPPGSSLAIGRAIADASEVGYSISTRNPRCDDGATRAMKLKPDKDYEYVVIYFASEEEAQQFMDRYEPPVLFLFEVKASCRD